MTRYRFACRAALIAGIVLISGGHKTAVAQSTVPDGVQTSQHLSMPQTEGTKQNVEAGKNAALNASPATAQAKPPAQHKVITNDDIDAEHARAAGKSGQPDLVYATGLCDDDCAEQASAQMGFGPGREGGWRIRLATARRHLQADTEWRQAYKDLGDAVKTRCIFEYQQQMAILPTSNTWDAGVERAQRQQYAENMERTLLQRVQSAGFQLARLAETVRPIEPVRATIMNVLVSRLYESSCMGEDP